MICDGVLVCADVLVCAGVLVCARVLISIAVLFSAAVLFCCDEEPREIRFSTAVNQQDLDSGLLTRSILHRTI